MPAGGGRTPDMSTHRVVPRRLLMGPAVGLALALALLGCGQARQGEGPGHRKQPLALSPQQEYEIGVQAYREVLEKADGNVLPQSSPEVQWVRRVGEKIVRASQ